MGNKDDYRRKAEQAKQKLYEAEHRLYLHSLLEPGRSGQPSDADSKNAWWALQVYLEQECEAARKAWRRAVTRIPNC